MTENCLVPVDDGCASVHSGGRCDAGVGHPASNHTKNIDKSSSLS